MRGEDGRLSWRPATAAPSPRRRQARLALWIGVAIVTASGIYVIVTAVRAVLVYRDMMEAKASLLAVEAVLRQEGLTVSDSTLAMAEPEALAARLQFRSAQRFLQEEPLLAIAHRLPWLGSQLEAAEELAGIGYEGSEVGLAGIEVLRAFNTMSRDDEGALGEKIVAFLDTVRPQMTRVEERLAAIRARRSALEGQLLPPLAGLVAEVDRRLPYLEESLRRYRSGDAVAAELLGYHGPMTYLILGQDNTELLPGGGLIGVYGLITMEQGRLTESVFADAGDIIEGWQIEQEGRYVQPPGPLKRYLLRDWSWNFGVSNWSPDFPTAARQALFFFEGGGGPPVEGVIALDFTTLEGLLAVLGPMSIADYGVTVSADSVTEVTLIRTRTVVRPGENKHAFAQAVASQVLDGALAGGHEKWTPLLETLERLAAQKHVTLYARDPALQGHLRELGWTGEVLDGPGDYLQVVEASVHSTKLNLVVEERAEVEIRLDAEGDARNTVTLYYENGLASWAEGRDPALVYDLMLSGFYGDYVRLLAPPQAILEEVTLNGQQVGIEEIALEAGKASFGRYLPLPDGARASLGFSYEVPAAVTVSKGVYEYRLLIQKQAGVKAMPLQISLSLPQGASLRSVDLDGRRLEDQPSRIETDLERDRELVVRYRQ